MICKNPFIRNSGAFGCGQCLPCRLNRRRLWTHRLILEALVHPGASFLTLTYEDANVPENSSLSPRDLQLFIKRLRHYTGAYLRYFAVGEYGDLTQRPHYHLALFGIGPIESADPVHKCWGLGHTHAGELTLQSAAYIAGYVTKKMTSKDDERLQGRYPEFARMSNRPGIGALAIGDLADALSNKHGWDEIGRTGDVPMALRHGPKLLPLGRYLRRKLREAMNFENVGQSEEGRLQQAQELLTLYEAHVANSEGPQQTIKEVLQEVNRQKILNMEKRAKIFAGVKTI